MERCTTVQRRTLPAPVPTLCLLSGLQVAAVEPPAHFYMESWTQAFITGDLIKTEEAPNHQETLQRPYKLNKS